MNLKNDKLLLIKIAKAIAIRVPYSPYEIQQVIIRHNSVDIAIEACEKASKEGIGLDDAAFIIFDKHDTKETE